MTVALLLSLFHPRSSSESDENDETVEDPAPDGVHYPAAIYEDSKRSKYKDGDLIISYNMFSFLSIWQENREGYSCKRAKDSRWLFRFKILKGKPSVRL